MTCANQQIVTCFEQLGMSPDEIAQSEGLDLAVVKAVLYKDSPKFREAISGTKELDFADQDLHEVNQIIKRIALYADDENLQFRAAKYIRDDKKGRKDVKTGLRGMNIKVTVLQQFNNHLREAARQLANSRGPKELTNGEQSKDVELVPA